MDLGSEPQRYFFMHIPKTAGMSLYHRLVHYHADSLYPLPFDRGRPAAAMDVDYLASRFHLFRHQIRVVTGHFPLCIEEMLGVPFTTFTLLRDPVERTLSFLRHRKQRTERFRDASLEDVYCDPYLLHGMIHNYMVKVLSMTVSEMRAGVATMVAYDVARLERAKENLEHRIAIFGLQESFDDLCEQLASHFDWDLGGTTSMFENRTDPLNVSDEFRARIADDNALDVELFAFANELLDRRQRPAKSPST